MADSECKNCGKPIFIDDEGGWLHDDGRPDSERQCALFAEPQNRPKITVTMQEPVDRTVYVPVPWGGTGGGMRA